MVFSSSRIWNSVSPTISVFRSFFRQHQRNPLIQFRQIRGRTRNFSNRISDYEFFIKTEPLYYFLCVPYVITLWERIISVEKAGVENQAENMNKCADSARTFQWPSEMMRRDLRFLCDFLFRGYAVDSSWNGENVLNCLFERAYYMRSMKI